MSRWAKTSHHCRLTICMKLVELSVSDDKIQITILILRRVALSSKDGIEDEDGDEGIFGITKLKLQAFSLATLKMILGYILERASFIEIR